MAISDPVADMLTKIRNGSSVQHEAVDVKPSKIGERILNVMQESGYIRTYKVIDEDVPAQKRIRVYLKYVGRRAAINQIKRVSSPGVRNYATKDTLPRVRNGAGIAIVTTSRGVMTDKQAYQQRIGGEVLCYVW